jgi:hypothetical protein
LIFPIFSFFNYFYRKYHFKNLLIGKLASDAATCLQPVVPAAASIPAVASVPGDVVYHNIPAGSAVDINSAVFVDVGVPWVTADVTVSAVAGIPVAAVVLTAFNVLGVPAVTRVSAVVAVPTAVYIPSH